KVYKCVRGPTDFTWYVNAFEPTSIEIFLEKSYLNWILNKGLKVELDDKSIELSARDWLEAHFASKVHSYHQIHSAKEQFRLLFRWLDSLRWAGTGGFDFKAKSILVEQKSAL